MSPRMRRAQIAAESVCVICPHCGEPQPNPYGGGSHQWAPHEVVKGSGRREFVSCDGPMFISLVRYVRSVAPWVDERAERQRYEMAHAAAWDAGNAHARAHGRKKWSRADYNAACREFARLMGSRLKGGQQ